jgi:CheY-like chemotaxis protein
MSSHLTSTILLVDDYPDALDVWGLYLRAVGFAVLTAADGPTALTMATEQHPDLIVLDLELPGKSGIEVAAILRAQASTRDIPLIAATGYSHMKQIGLAHEAGFNAVVIKPCDPDALLREIRRLLPPKDGNLAGDQNGTTQKRNG